MIGLKTSDVGRAVRDTVVGTATAGIERYRVQLRNGNAFDEIAWRQLVDAGLLGARVREELGGSALTAEAADGIAEMLGETLAPDPYLELGLLPSLLLDAIGSESRLAELIDGTARFCVAWQEQADQLCANEAVQTIVTTGAAGLRLRGTKRFVAGGGSATALLVSASIDGRMVIVVVPADAPGVTIEDHRRIDGSSCSDIRFTDVAVEEEALMTIDAAAFDRALDETRIACAVHLLGVARRALQLSLDYAKTRRQFGQPIGSFQALQHRMVDLAMAVRLGEVMCDAALRLLDDPAATAGEVAMRAAAVKAQAGEAAELVTRSAVQLHGAIGYTDEADIGLYLYRALALAPWLGTPAGLRRRYLQLLDRNDA